jgi:medium-chain acyl-[acyl-carrier-protein] hydrolase
MRTLGSWHEDNVYCRELELAFYDCDLHKKAKLSTIMKYIADTAGKDYTDRGLSHDVLLKNNQVFLLSRASIHIERVPEYNETITVKTWERGIGGPYFFRDYEILDHSAGKCVLATSAWVLVDPGTRQIQRPSKFAHHQVPDLKMIEGCRSCERIKVPDNMSFLGNRKIMFSDIDGNGHVYNANYVSIALDYLPYEKQIEDLSDFSINFIKEAKLGEVMDLYSSFDIEPNRTVIIGKNGDSICFECELYNTLP